VPQFKLSQCLALAIQRGKSSRWRAAGYEPRSEEPEIGTILAGQCARIRDPARHRQAPEALPGNAWSVIQLYLLYRKIASAIRTTVTIHRIVLLFLFFSSGMGKSTTQK
jgi:hypothetical protein